MPDPQAISMAGSKEKVRELYDALMTVKNGKEQDEVTVYFREAAITVYRSADDDSLILIQVKQR